MARMNDMEEKGNIATVCLNDDTKEKSKSDFEKVEDEKEESAIVDESHLEDMKAELLARSSKDGWSSGGAGDQQAARSQGPAGSGGAAGRLEQRRGRGPVGDGEPGTREEADGRGREVVDEGRRCRWATEGRREADREPGRWGQRELPAGAGESSRWGLEWCRRRLYGACSMAGAPWEWHSDGGLVAPRWLGGGVRAIVSSVDGPWWLGGGAGAGSGDDLGDWSGGFRRWAEAAGSRGPAGGGGAAGRPEHDGAGDQQVAGSRGPGRRSTVGARKRSVKVGGAARVLEVAERPTRG
ncbi:uncharacterized protein LOC131859081 [Cryptomeria japonica]|uniref:uncharacterized protein LOC131859081 n=1 Tax=Cryptomeria japonica TaxID=3369 RepID=UPI0027D9DAB0|nr:uncharacterized protein LOC131859081 [Cryptomeria japonica]